MNEPDQTKSNAMGMRPMQQRAWQFRCCVAKAERRFATVAYTYTT